MSIRGPVLALTVFVVYLAVFGANVYLGMKGHIPNQVTSYGMGVIFAFCWPVLWKEYRR